jgi:hypothetical protein
VGRRRVDLEWTRVLPGLGQARRRLTELLFLLRPLRAVQGRLIVARPATREIFHHLILFYFIFLKKIGKRSDDGRPAAAAPAEARGQISRVGGRAAHLVQRGSDGDLALVLRRRVVPAALRVRERGVGASGPAPLGGGGSRGRGGLDLRHRPRPAPAPREDLQVRGRGARALAPPVPRPHEPAYVAQNGGHLQLLGLRRILHGRAPRRGVCVRWLRNRAAAARCGRASERIASWAPLRSQAVWFNRGGRAPWRHVATRPRGLGCRREDDTQGPPHRD